MNEPFIVSTETEIWTRNTKNGAIGLADNVARVRGVTATVAYNAPIIVPFYWAFGAKEGAD